MIGLGASDPKYYIWLNLQAKNIDRGCGVWEWNTTQMAIKAKGESEKSQYKARTGERVAITLFLI